MLNILISLGQHAADAQPVRTETTWQQFVQWLHSLPRSAAGITPAEYEYLSQFPSKSPEGQRLHADKSGPYVVLADFGGHRRHLDNLLASFGVPLDFDGSHVTADVIRATLHGYAYVAYSTYAHGPGNERWRVFVPVAKPMTNAEHYATWEMLSNAFARAADPAAKDPSRLSYLPGKCLHPEYAAIFHSDGAFLQPAPAIEVAPAVLQVQSDGPVPGWAGPADDATLIEIACSLRNRPDERFGGPIHFAMLWSANDDWLAKKFPPAHGSQQSWEYTQADMALAGELAYWTGSDSARMARLMRCSGLANVRVNDMDWSERKVALAVDRAVSNAKQWHFMTKAPPPPVDSVEELAVHIGEQPPPPPGVPPVPTSMDPAVSVNDAAVFNAGTLPGLNDYWAYLPTAQFIHRPTGMLHVASSVDGTIGKDARAALVVSRPVHKMTWAPGFAERFQIGDIDPTDERGATSWLYNTYMPPRTPIVVGDASPWLDMLRELYPDDADHIVNYFADAVQFPQHKCNHALVLGSGVHGIGKDTLLAPIRHAVGERNFWAIKPGDVVGPYNPFVKSVILQISESRDLGEGQHGVSRYELYERTKDLWAAPPKMLTCNDKYIAQHPVLNVCRGVMTTNHLVDGIYLPPEDRRHYCAWSDAEKMTEEKANAMWDWYANGGMDIVANYLATFDLDAVGWNRSAPPRQTPWWHQLVEGAKPAEDDRFGEAMDQLGHPEWVTLGMVAGAGGLELAGWIAAPGNKRKVEREMDRAGYRRFPNPADKRGRWYVGGVQMPVYRRANVRVVDLLKKFNATTGVKTPA